MTHEDMLKTYGEGKEALSIYHLYGPPEPLFTLFFSFLRHFGPSCTHGSLEAGQLPKFLSAVGYDYAKMVETNLIAPDDDLMALTVPQLYTVEKVCASTLLFPSVFVHYELLVREKATQEIVDNRFAWCKQGRVVKHELFLTPEELACSHKASAMSGSNVGPSIFDTCWME